LQSDQTCLERGYPGPYLVTGHTRLSSPSIRCPQCHLTLQIESRDRCHPPRGKCITSPTNVSFGTLPLLAVFFYGDP
jgi:hypothetical protein